MDIVSVSLKNQNLIPESSTSYNAKLMCPVGDVIIHVTTVSDYLVRGVSVVDGNGDLVTALDNDLEKKLVVISNDLNLWYALLQSALKDEEINIETIPGRYVKF